MSIQDRASKTHRLQAGVWLVLLLLAIGLGLVLLHRVAINNGTLPQEIKLLELMTASGTVGAVIVALWLSFVQRREQALANAAVAELFQRMLVGNILAAWSDLLLLREVCARTDLDGLRQYLRSARAGLYFDALHAHIEKSTTLPHADLVVVANIYGYIQLIEHETRAWHRMGQQDDDLESLARLVQTTAQLFATFANTPWIRSELPRWDRDVAS
ncbi:hypothetical protein [Bordetella genomosp. 12]|uniref:DUF4760 domain-containing protein n=1 Tax=Bordetella genomosp. 12 TaxID=463035 RepID=A0A261VUF1_9BORD|nr:hypothetical protein [Bordetella genomosp. 12]OZI77736.1 hypothetical protein CAL22_04180 [Bordetella genomosp. 12]